MHHWKMSNKPTNWHFFTQVFWSCLGRGSHLAVSRSNQMTPNTWPGVTEQSTLLPRMAALTVCFPNYFSILLYSSAALIAVTYLCSLAISGRRASTGWKERLMLVCLPSQGGQEGQCWRSCRTTALRGEHLPQTPNAAAGIHLV